MRYAEEQHKPSCVVRQLGPAKARRPFRSTADSRRDRHSGGPCPWTVKAVKASACITVLIVMGAVVLGRQAGREFSEISDIDLYGRFRRSCVSWLNLEG